MNLIQHRTDLTEIGLGFRGYFPFPDFWSLGSGISRSGLRSRVVPGPDRPRAQVTVSQVQADLGLGSRCPRPRQTSGSGHGVPGAGRPRAQVTVSQPQADQKLRSRCQADLGLGSRCPSPRQTKSSGHGVPASPRQTKSSGHGVPGPGRPRAQVTVSQAQTDLGLRSRCPRSRHTSGSGHGVPGPGRPRAQVTVSQAH